MRKARDKSTISKSEYISWHLFFGGMISYELIYDLLPRLTLVAHVNRSYFKIIICFLAASVFGFMVTYKNNRTIKELLSNCSLGVGIYLIWMFGKYTPNFIRWTLRIAVIITGMGMALILYSYMTKKKNRKDLLLKKLIKWIRRNAVITCTIIVIAVPCILHFSEQHKVTGTSNSNVLKLYQVYDEKYSLTKNINQIKLIRYNDTFQNLTYDQKCKVVKAVLYSEGNYLGLDKFQIKFEDLKDNTLGRFHPKTNCIIINGKQLRNGSMDGGDAKSVLNTCLHECRHYFQHLMVDVYERSTPKQRNMMVLKNTPITDWIKNEKDYHNGDGNAQEYDKYVKQPVEKDAREYANSQIKVYYKIIDSLIYTGR